MTEALQQQILLLTEFKQKLVEEQDLIVASNADGLLSLVREKEKLLESINQNDSLLKAANAAHSLTEEQRRFAEEGKQLLLQCQQQTEVNARIVEKNQIRVQRLRNMMMATRNKESMTYTNKGKTQGGMLGGAIKA